MASYGKNGDPYGIRTHVTAVKGPCLNHLTTGPCHRTGRERRTKGVSPGDAPGVPRGLVAAPGFEPGTLRV